MNFGSGSFKTYSSPVVAFHNVPEQFGMLRNQAVPFHIKMEDRVRLHAWHIVPLRVYERNEGTIVGGQALTGPVEDPTKTINLRLLRDDPEARLVLHSSKD